MTSARTHDRQSAGDHAVVRARMLWRNGRALAERVVTDRRLGITTAGWIPLARLGLGHPERVSYQPSPWRTLRLVLKPDEVGPEDVFIDVGAGKGRVVLEAAVHYPFGKVMGLELSPELAGVARANISAASGVRCADVEIVVGDVTQYVLPDEATVIFLYNPFRGTIFSKFLAGVLASLERRPRRLRIVYRSPFEHEQLLGTGRFRLIREHRPARPTARTRETGAVRLYEGQ